jgi:hypothetical protein
MVRTVITFLAAAIVGAVLALVVRAAFHRPGDVPSVAAVPVPVVAPVAAATAAPLPVVNTVCPICCMDVNPSLTPATYQDVRVGFGCAGCPPTFAKDPARYGEAAKKNQVVP